MADTRNLRTHFRMRYAGAGPNLQPVEFLDDTVVDGQMKSPKLPTKKLVPKTININGQQESRLYGAARYEDLEFTASALGESSWHLNRLLFGLVQIEYYDTVTGACASTYPQPARYPLP